MDRFRAIFLRPVPYKIIEYIFFHFYIIPIEYYVICCLIFERGDSMLL